MLQPEVQQKTEQSFEQYNPYQARIPYVGDEPPTTTFESRNMGPQPPLPPDQRATAQDQVPPPKRSRVRTGALVALVLVLALVLGTGAFAGWEFGQGRSLGMITAPPTTSQTPATATVPASGANSVDTTRESVAARLRPAVVEITGDTTDGQVIGSGVIIDARGYIVTNDHVVDGAQHLQTVLASGSQLNTQLVGTDVADDLAVLKINPPANMVVAQISSSSQTQVGEEVLAIGNPLGITQTVTHGIVSALNRSVPEPNGQQLTNLIQTDAPINPGNSGGALVDLQGNLVGIPTLNAVDQESNTAANGIGFAIPASRVQTVVQQIIQHGSITQ